MLILKPFSSHYLDQTNDVPQIADGFDYFSKSAFKRVKKDKDRYSSPLFPVSFFTPAKPFSTYEVTVTVTAKQDVDSLSLFSGRRQLQALVSLKAGETFQKKFYQSLTEIIPFRNNQRYRLDKLFVTYCTENRDYIDFHCTATEKEVPRIFLCGDSTVTDQIGKVPFVPAMNHSSWGQSLPAFMDAEIAVDNQATSGNTTESFRMEGHFDIVEQNIAPGDICMFQFGHNDQKLDYLQPDQQFETNIVRYIKEIREKDAVPVLVTPLARNTWDNKGMYLDLLMDYDKKVNQLAHTYEVPIIQLHEKSKQLWKSMGKERSTDYFPKGDYTHTNEFGSYKIAAIIADSFTQLFPSLPTKTLASFEPAKQLWSAYEETGLPITDGENPSNQLHQIEDSVQQLIDVIQHAKKGNEPTLKQ